MKSLILIVACLLLAGVFVVLAFNTTSNSKQGKSNVPSKNQLRWHAAEAKKEGKTRVEIPTEISEYLGSASNIDEALSQCTVVIAEPVESRTYETDDNRLTTWHKFRIVERLTELKTPPCLGCLSITPPLDMPLDYSSEFLVPRLGGTAIIDGVQIEQKERGFPLFEDRQRYLLFVSIYPNGIGLTAGGPNGIFPIAPNDQLKPLSEHPNLIGSGMKTRFQNSLPNLKQKLSNR